jgi:hypothetical protein
VPQHNVIKSREPVPVVERPWNEYGPAMQALTAQQRAFVTHYVAEVMVKPYGAATRAARKAGYGYQTTSPHPHVSRMAHKLLHDPTYSPKIVEAIGEESRRLIRLGAPEAVGALLKLVRDPASPHHFRALDAIIQRSDPLKTEHSINVTHRVQNADEEALEELRAAREIGASREKLIEIFGGNGLTRLERLEAADIERRAEKATVIEHE